MNASDTLLSDSNSKFSPSISNKVKLNRLLKIDGDFFSHEKDPKRSEMNLLVDNRELYDEKVEESEDKELEDVEEDEMNDESSSLLDWI